jgi:hypothetical protein
MNDGFSSSRECLLITLWIDKGHCSIQRPTAQVTAALQLKSTKEIRERKK